MSAKSQVIVGDQPMCEATNGSGRPCGNRAQWTVRYLEPDTPGKMRRRVTTKRCTAHNERQSAFPPGASCITVLGSWTHGTLQLRSSIPHPGDEG